MKTTSQNDTGKNLRFWQLIKLPVLVIALQLGTLVFFTPNSVLAQAIRCESIFSPQRSREIIFRETLATSKIDNELALTLYGPQGPQILKRLTDLNPGFEIFILDPGVIQRLDSFVEFIQNHNLSVLPAADVRAQFSAHLGNRTYYRALSVSTEEARSITQTGIASALSRKVSTLPPKEARWELSDSLMDNVTNGLVARVYNQVASYKQDPFLSISQNPDVAMGVAGRYLKENTNVYLAKLSIPEIEVVSLKNPEGSGQDRPFYDRWDQYDMIMRIHKNEGNIDHQWKDGPVEFFVLYEIHPTEIVEMKQIKKEDLPSISFFRTTANKKASGE